MSETGKAGRKRDGWEILGNGFSRCLLTPMQRLTSGLKQLRWKLYPRYRIRVRQEVWRWGYCLKGKDRSTSSLNRAFRDAARDGNAHNAAIFIGRGADVHQRVLYDYPLLGWVAQLGHTEVARLLLSAGAEIEAQDAIIGFTPLALACRKGHCDLIALLLERGARLESRTRGGTTPLLCAVLNHQTEAVALLLKDYARRQWKPTQARACMQYARQNKLIEIAELLEGAGIPKETHLLQPASPPAAAVSTSSRGETAKRSPVRSRPASRRLRRSRFRKKR